jgi:hypothetical protein
MVVRLMLFWIVRQEPSMNRKFPQLGWAVWKLAGLPFEAFSVSARCEDWNIPDPKELPPAEFRHSPEWLHVPPVRIFALRYIR